MEFSKEERIEIDKELAKVREEQRKNGNKLYPFEEISRRILNKVRT